MQKDINARRDFLMQAGIAGVAAMGFAAGDVKAETLPPPPEFKPQHKVRFSVAASATTISMA